MKLFRSLSAALTSVLLLVALPSRAQLVSREISVVTVRAIDAQAVEGISSGAFLVERTGGLETPLTVPYQLIGSATPGSDYMQPNTQVSFAAGASNAVITITPVADSLLEDSEVVILRLFPMGELPANGIANSVYQLGSSSSASITIMDSPIRGTNSVPSISLHPSSRPGGSQGFNFFRTGPLNSAVRITYSVIGTPIKDPRFDGTTVNTQSIPMVQPAVPGVDYVPVNGEVVFSAGSAFGYVPLLPTPLNPSSSQPMHVTILLSETSGLARNGSGQASLLLNLKTPDVAGVKIVTPLDGAVLSSGTVIPVEAAASGLPGTGVVPDIALFLGNTFYVSGHTNDLKTSLQKLAPGTYSLTAQLLYPSDIRGVNKTAFSTPVTFTVVPAGEIPTVTFAAAGPFTILEGQNQKLSVRMTPTPTSTRTVAYEVTAKSPSPLVFTPTTGTLTFQEGQSTVSFVVATMPNGISNPDTTLLVALKPSIAYKLGDASVVSILVKDADTNVSPSVSILSPQSGTIEAPANPVPVYVYAKPGSSEIREIALYDRTEKIGSLSAASGVFQWSATTPGTHSLTATALDSAGRRRTSSPVSITITAPANPPFITVFTGDARSISEAKTNSLAVTFSRQAASTNPLRVYYTLGGTATYAKDYLCPTGSVVIPAGAVSTNILISAVDDKIHEPTETIVFTISSNAFYKVGQPGAATVLIEDNDPALPPTVAIVSPTNGASVVVGQTNTVTVRTETNGNAVKSVQLYINGLSAGIRTNEPWAFSWTPTATGTAELFAEVLDSEGLKSVSTKIRVSIVASNPGLDRPVINVVATDAEAVEPIADGKPANTGTFTLTRSGPTNTSLIVYYTIGGTATPGTDYVELPGYVLLGAGQRATNVIVHPLLDLVKEQPETVILSLLAVDCMTNAAPVRPCYTVGPTNKATVQILDSSTNAPPTSNAIPVVVITAPASNKVFSAGSVVEVSAVATDSDGYAAHADLYDGTNHVGVSEITFIRAPDPGTPITHSFRLTNLLSGSHILLATARDDKGLIGYSQKVPIQIGSGHPSNSLPVVWVEASAPFAYESNRVEGVFVIHRDGNTNDAIKVPFLLDGTASMGLDYPQIANYVLISAGVTAVKVVIVPNPDSLIEGNETVNLHLNVENGYTLKQPTNATIIIVDDTSSLPPLERNVVSLSVMTNTAYESPTNRYALALVTRTGSTNLALDVFYRLGGSASNGVDYVRLSGTVTIPAGTRSAPIQIIALADSIKEEIETIELTIVEPICPAIFPPPPSCYQVGATNKGIIQILDASASPPPTNGVPVVVITAPTNNAAFTVHASIDVSAIAVDQDGYAAHAELYDRTNRVGVSDIVFIREPTPGSPIHHTFQLTNLAVGEHILQVVARDNLGLMGYSQKVPIIAQNPPMTAMIPGDMAQAQAVTVTVASMNNMGTTLNLRGPVGAPILIESSHDLAHWTHVTTVENPTGTTHYTDPSGTAHATHFYRARLH